MEKPRKTAAGKYQARYTDERGKRRSAGTFLTKRDAQRAIADALRAIEKGRTSPLANTMTVAEYVPHYLRTREGEVTPETLVNYERLLRRYVVPTFGRSRLGDVRRSQVRQWVTGFRSPATRRQAYSVLSSLMRMAFADDLIARPLPPVRNAMRIEPAKPKRGYSEAEVWSVLDALPERHRLIAVVQFGLSARLSEVLGLDWDAVDLKTGRVDIRQQFYKGTIVQRVKHGSGGAVYLTDWALAALRAHHKERPGIGASPVFVNAEGRRQQEKGFREAWAAAPTIAGLPDLVPQDLRHTSLSAFQRLAGDLVQTMNRARHRDYRSALGYQHVPDERPALLDEFSARTAR